MNDLQHVRESAGYITVEALAVKAGVSPSTIRRAENGGILRRSNALRIAQALGKEPDEIGLLYVGKGPVNGRATERLENL